MLVIAIIYGLIAGVVCIAAIILSFSLGDSQHLAGTEWLGYLVMILALSLIFFGIKRHRDHDHGGTIRFVPAATLGILIAIVASLAYVIVWEIYLAATDYSFMAQYAKSIIAQRAVEGASEQDLIALTAEMDAMQVQYANPAFRMPLTFMEIFPVGVIITLISAILLRNPRIAPAKA